MFYGLNAKRTPYLFLSAVIATTQRFEVLKWPYAYAAPRRANV